MDNDNPSFLVDVAKQTTRLGGGTSARAGISMDTSQMKAFNQELKTVNETLNSIKQKLPGVLQGLGQIFKASSGMSVAGTGGNANGVATALSTSTNPVISGAGGPPTPPGGLPAPTGGLGPERRAELKGLVKQYGVDMALSAATGLVNAMDKRIDRGADYALSADRMSVLYQQMTGLSQVDVQNRYRQPLTNYRLGAGGINTLLGLQAETGLNAQQQAPSMEAIRAMSGYTLGAGDVSNMMSALARPETVNRMFMMTGQSMYGFGGKQNSAMDVIRNTVQTLGLTDKRQIETAFQPGSITRERLRQSGIPEDMITTVLQYARENVTFKEKGGKGMYSPESKEQRKLMGIEDNFATQVEETERVKTAREEKFYSRQADNLADMERATQAVTKALGALEDKLSGIVGARTSTRPFQKAGGGFLKSLGGLAKVAGVALGVGAVLGTGGLSLAALPAAAALFTGGSTAEGVGGVLQGTGDGEFNSGTKSGNKTKTATKSSPKSDNLPAAPTTGRYANLNPRFAARVAAMLKDNNKVRIGNGWRSSDSQEKLFLSRYERSNEKTDLFWDGTYWKHVRGAPAAPPGRSMHEIGLAADLVGDLDWVQENAHKYGLKTFANVNNEPWHVQPSELPNSRREYEGKGAPWGTDNSAQKDDDTGPSDTPPQTDGTGSTPPATPNTPGASTAPNNSGSTVMAPRDNSITRGYGTSTGVRKITSYAGSSMQDVIAQLKRKTTMGASSSLMSFSSDAMHEGDGSFSSGLKPFTAMSSVLPDMHIGSIGVNPDSAPALVGASGGSTGSLVNHVTHGGDTYNISPVINFNGNISDVARQDLRKIAKELVDLIEDENRLRAVRRG